MGENALTERGDANLLSPVGADSISAHFLLPHNGRFMNRPYDYTVLYPPNGAPRNAVVEQLLPPYNNFRNESILKGATYENSPNRIFDHPI